MPTILRVGPYRLYFFSHEPDEPPHVHVDRDRSSAKFWLRTVSVARSVGFNSAELRTMERLIQNHREDLLRAWDDYFGR
ncbi:MAG: DUF4160 domain-containing protein [Acidobacteriota bacterium]